MFFLLYSANPIMYNHLFTLFSQLHKLFTTLSDQCQAKTFSTVKNPPLISSHTLPDRLPVVDWVQQLLYYYYCGMDLGLVLRGKRPVAQIRIQCIYHLDHRQLFNTSTSSGSQQKPMQHQLGIKWQFNQPGMPGSMSILVFSIET